VDLDIDQYCRAIEAYLCRKNDGHLIRIVGPSFERVCGWAARGIPLGVAYRGIDRYFERYYANGGRRRRPVAVQFCEADVLDVFDEWRRAIGITDSPVDGQASDANDGSAESFAVRRQASLPQHLERVVLRLSEARARGTLSDDFDDLIDRVSRELDAVRSKSGGIRGEARQGVVERLLALDAELIDRARALVADAERARIQHEADEELAAYRTSMTPDMFASVRVAAMDRLIRERFSLPTISYQQG
jgi:hypothetical protein